MNQPAEPKRPCAELDPRVAELLLRYEVQREQGQPLTAHELCASCPELLPEVERHLGALERLGPLLDSTRSGANRAGKETPSATPPGRPLLPPVFGRYRIEKQLGAGGMGTVYLAHDTKLGRRVALKVPHFTARTDTAIRERFYREARAAATLQHPGICPIFDVGEHDGIPYLSMAYIDGRPLSEPMGGKAWPAVAAAQLVRKVALAMAEAHRRGIVHRDLKPSNIMLDTRGEPVVMDFGLARRAGGDTSSDERLTQPGMAVGTPAYMPPEQVRGDQEAVGPRSDIYSLGVLLYELLAGMLPFRGRGFAILSQILTEPAVPLEQARPSVPSRLARICAQAMARDPAERFADMDALAAALTAYLDDAAARQARGRTRRRWVTVAAAAALAIVLGVVVYISTARGTVKIEIDDPRATVTINGDAVTIDKLGEPITLWAGKHVLTVKRGDITVKTDEFVLHRGDHKVLEISLLEKAAAPEPVGARERAAACVVRARKLYADKRLEEAIAACTEAIKLDPKNANAYIERSSAAIDLGNQEAGLRDLTRAIELEPGNGNIYVWRSAVYLNRQPPDFIRCIADANQAIAIGNTTAKETAYAYANRGWALAHLGHYEMARADLDEANRWSPVFYLCRSKVNEKLGEREAAEADRARAAKVEHRLRIGDLPPPPPLPDGKPGTELRQFTVPSDRYAAVALAPSGRLALTGGYNGRVILWDVATGGELCRLTEQKQMIMGLAFSPDGRHALSVSGWIAANGAQPITPGTDFRIPLWDVAARQVRHYLTGHTGSVRMARFSPDGKQVLSAGDDGTVRLWDVDSGKSIRTFKGESVFGLAYLPDGKRALLSNFASGKTALLALESGQENVTLPHDDLVPTVACAPNGHRALTGCWDHGMRLWDLATGTRLKAVKFPGLIAQVAFANNGRWAVVATGGLRSAKASAAPGGPDHAVHIVDLATDATIKVLPHDGGVTTLDLSRDGRYLISGSDDGTARLWRMPDPPRDREAVAGGAHERAAAFLMRARRLYSEKHYEQTIGACTDALDLDPKNVDAYLVRSNALYDLGKRADALKDLTEALRHDPKNAQLYVNRSFIHLNLAEPNELRCIDDANTALALGNLSEGSRGAAYANRGWALARLGHYALALADIDAANRVDPVYYSSRGKVHKALGDIGAAKDDEARAAQEPRSVLVRDLPPAPALPDGPPGRALRSLRPVPMGNQIDGVALSPAGRLAITGDGRGKTLLWDLATGGELFRFPDQPDAVYAVDISPDGQRALIGYGKAIQTGKEPVGADCSILVWDLARRRPLHALTGHTRIVTSARFSPDGKHILSASFGGATRLWDAATGKLIRELPAVGEGVRIVAFAPDGTKALIAGGETQAVHWVDLATGNEIAALPHKGFIRAVAYAPDGKHALCGCWDKKMYLWDLATKQIVRTFPEHGTIINAVAFANQGRWAIACTGGIVTGISRAVPGGADHAVHIYDTATGKPVLVLRGHESDVMNAVVSGDGRYLLSGSGDGTARLWRLPAPPVK